MKTKNEYSIKISGINSDWPNYRLWKNGQDIDPYELTIEEIELIAEELIDYCKMFKNNIDNIKQP